MAPSVKLPVVLPGLVTVGVGRLAIIVGVADTASAVASPVACPGTPVAADATGVIVATMGVGSGVARLQATRSKLMVWNTARSKPSLCNFRCELRPRLTIYSPC